MNKIDLVLQKNKETIANTLLKHREITNLNKVLIIPTIVEMKQFKENLFYIVNDYINSKFNTDLNLNGVKYIHTPKFVYTIFSQDYINNKIKNSDKDSSIKILNQPCITKSDTLLLSENLRSSSTYLFKTGSVDNTLNVANDSDIVSRLDEFIQIENFFETSILKRFENISNASLAMVHEFINSNLKIKDINLAEEDSLVFENEKGCLISSLLFNLWNKHQLAIINKMCSHFLDNYGISDAGAEKLLNLKLNNKEYCSVENMETDKYTEVRQLIDNFEKRLAILNSNLQVIKTKM